MNACIDASRSHDAPSVEYDQAAYGKSTPVIIIDPGWHARMLDCRQRGEHYPARCGIVVPLVGTAPELARRSILIDLVTQYT